MDPAPSEQPSEPRGGNGELPAANGALLATPATAAAIAAAPALAILIGGYDGSGNYGDIALLDANLDLLEKTGLLPLPVVERGFATTHEAMLERFANPPEHVLYFDPEGCGDGEALLPIDPRPGLALAAIHLYGGGFLNPSWGGRKLAMLRAAEAATAPARQVTRVASGLQVDPAWIGSLGEADAGALRRFELLGARDEVSVAALTRLGGAEVANSGDDATALLGRAGPFSEPAAGSPLLVNVHCGEHDWVSEEPEALPGFIAALVAALGGAGGGARVRPLLAYVDQRIDERRALGRLTAACEERGVAIAEPVVLRPADSDAFATEIGGAHLTVSSSFHVALTAALGAMPTVLLRNNDYYDQKARGLLRDFGLPECFSPSSTADPGQLAGELTPYLSGETGRKLRADLREAGAAARLRRAEAETWLLARLTAAATAGASAAGEALDEVLASNSWRLTEPLRRLRGERGRR